MFEEDILDSDTFLHEWIMILMTMILSRMYRIPTTSDI
jgi:hypothetical protein